MCVNCDDFFFDDYCIECDDFEDDEEEEVATPFSFDYDYCLDDIDDEYEDEDVVDDNEFADNKSVKNNTTTFKENNTMQVNTTKAPFQPVTVVFNNESELHDVIAALAAYSRKTSSVSSSSIQSDFNLTAYTGNARKTVKAILPQLTATI